jgi:hypothetical protein
LCSDSWGGSTTIKYGTATDLNTCIDQCVTNKQTAKYTQCIGVTFGSTVGNTCALLNFATFPNGMGVQEIAGLKFSEEPFPLPPGLCESAVSSLLATASLP